MTQAAKRARLGRVVLAVAWMGLLGFLSRDVGAADTLTWDTSRNSVSADIKAASLEDVLERVAAATGWRVYVEPDTAHAVSTKFTGVSSGEALRLLLGDVNFALLPDTNSSRLFVFRTSRQNATQLVRAAKPKEDQTQSKAIPNELIVRLKPGAKIDDLAKLLGAKVVGRIDSLNAYRLQFDDAASTESARQQLASNSDVASVDSNYSVDPPTGPRAMASAGATPLQLQLKSGSGSGKVIVGLVDTSVQSLGNNLDQFFLKSVSVVDSSSSSSSSPTHGTAMAETILQSIQELTKGSTSVQILPVNVYPSTGSGETATTTFDVSNGIIQAANNGATVINLSLGSSSDSTFLHSTIQDVTKLGILVFAAAGNEPVTTPTYPAAYSEVSAVTAVEQGQLASYANRGSFVSLATSGNSLISYNGQTYSIVGTSTSTAYISGAVAGYMDAQKATASQARTFINNNFGVRISTR